MATELDELVIRLTGDAEAYLRMLDEAKTQTTSATDEIQKGVDRLEASFANQADTFGMTGREAQLYQLQLQGASEEQLANAQAIGEQLTAMEQQRSLMQELAVGSKEVETSAERYARQVSELDGYLKKGTLTQEEYNEAVKQAKTIADGTTTTLEKMGVAAAGLAAIFGGGAWLREAFGAFSEAEDVDIGLAATLKANGRAVEDLMGDYQEFATSIQDVTTMGDESVKMLLKQAESFELTGDAAKRAVKDAIGLAEAADSSAEAMIRITQAIAKGDIETAMMFSRPVKQLRGIKDEATFIERYQKLVASGMEESAKKAETAAGRIKQLKESYGDLMEQFGKVIADGVLPLVTSLRTLVLWFQTLPAWVKTAAVVLAGLTVALVGVSTTLPIVISAFAAVKVAVMAFSTSLVTNPITMWIVAITAAVAIVYGLSSAISGADKEVQRLNKSFETADRFQEAYEKRYRGVTSQGIQETQGMEYAERAKAIQTQLDRAREDLRRNKAGQARAEKRLEDFNIPILGTIIGRNIDKGVFEQNTKQLEESKKRVELTRERVEQLEVALGRIPKPASEAAKAIEKAMEAVNVGIAKRVDDLTKLMETGKDLAKEMRTPLEVYRDRVKELQELLKVDAIKPEIYSRALEKAETDLLKVGEAADKAKESIEQLDSVAFGSAESLRRVEAFRQLVQKPMAINTDVNQVTRAIAKVNLAPGTLDRKEETGLLKDIRDGILALVRKEPVEVEPAGLGG